MARIWQSGFELGHAREWTLVSGAAATFDTSVKRTGSYSGKISSLSSATRAGFLMSFISAANGPYFLRVYLRLDTLPTANNTIIALVNGTAINSTIAMCIKVTSTGTLILCNSTGTQIGSASAALTTGVQYRVSFKYDRSGAGGAQVLEAKLNGIVFATDSTLTITNQIQSLIVGGNLQAESQTTGVWYFDDIAINDTTGTQQTEYPNKGAIVHARPNGAGDNSGWTIAGSSPAATRHDSVNEVAPDDAVTLVEATGLGLTDDYTVGALSDIGTTDNIITVTVGVRFSHPTAVGANGAGLTTRLKAVTGGTVDTSATIASNGTPWFTNTSSGFIRPNYPLVTYFKPGTSTPWTKADLSAAQIGMRISNSNAAKAQVSTLWMSVDFAPIDNFTMTLTDSITPTETLIKSISREVTDSINLTESFLKSTGKILTDSVTFTETLTTMIGRTFTDTVTLIEMFGRNFTKALYDFMVSAYLLQEDGSYVLQEDGSRVIIDGEMGSVNDTLNKSVVKQPFFDEITLVETFIVEYIRAVAKSICVGLVVLKNTITYRLKKASITFRKL